MLELKSSATVQSFQDRGEVNFASAVLGASRLIEKLQHNTIDASSLSKVKRALDIMFEIHKDQIRPDGSPYVNHTLLVAKILVLKFGIADHDAVVAALLHDGPEDQSQRINALLGNKNCDDKESAILSLSHEVGGNPIRVSQFLRDLTNPDFYHLSLLLKSEQLVDRAELAHANRLMSLALGDNSWISDTTRQNEIRQLSSGDICKKLYLGHWIELIEGNTDALAIKAADFYSNGLHRHLLLKGIDEGPGKFSGVAQARKFSDKIREKYSPVVELLERHLIDASSSGRVLINEKADSLLLGKIRFVKPFYLEPSSIDRANV